jgi:hypothetical protein
LSDYEQRFLAPSSRHKLSLADAVVLDHCIQLTKAVTFIETVDPWQYIINPGEDIVSPPAVRSFVKSAVAKASLVGQNFSDFTEESLATYLLSPLLVQKRPPLVRIPKAARTALRPPGAPKCSKLVTKVAATISVSVSGTHPGPQVLPEASTLATVALERAVEPAPPSQPGPRVLPETSTPVAASEAPEYMFQLGSSVHVHPETWPCVRPIHAEGIIFATVHGHTKHVSTATRDSGVTTAAQLASRLPA